MSGYLAGIVQMDSTADLAGNLDRIEFFVEKAAAAGARLVSLPETANLIAADPAKAAETIPGPTTERLAALARRHGLWIHGGSLWEKEAGERISPVPAEPLEHHGRPNEIKPPPGKPWNTTVLIDPEGKAVSRYQKLHLFDVEVEDGPSFRESDHISPGQWMVRTDTEFGRFGFTICYDLRFPELFRLLALGGAEVIFVPACFTEATGRAHWEPLLRARAIENGCYILAAAQCGLKPKYLAHGHSLAVSPWGEIIARQPEGEGLILAEIDLEAVKAARRQIPALANRRDDIYRLQGRFKNS